MLCGFGTALVVALAHLAQMSGCLQLKFFFCGGEDNKDTGEIDGVEPSRAEAPCQPRDGG